MGIRSGRLRTQVTVERQSQTQDAIGQPVDTWATLVSRMADIDPIVGREYFNASGESADTRVRIRMRYDATVGGIKAHDRVVDNNTSPATIYDIESPPINVRNRNFEIVLMCRQVP